jgi:hypothetical protein
MRSDCISFVCLFIYFLTYFAHFMIVEVPDGIYLFAVHLEYGLSRSLYYGADK